MSDDQNQNAPEAQDKILCAFLPPVGPSITEVFKQFQKHSQLDLKKFDEMNSLARAALNANAVMIFIHIQDQQQVLAVRSFLRALKPAITAQKAKVIVSSEIDHPVIYQKLGELGASEVLVEPVSPRAVAFKLNRYIQLLGRQLKAAQMKQSNARRGGLGGGASRAQEETQSSAVKQVEALSIESDYWLLKGGGARRVMGRWTILLKGPSPDSGKWISIESSKGSEPYWQWKLEDPENSPLNLGEAGYWVFGGQRPAFRNDVWSFIGKNPILAFRNQNEILGQKVYYDSKKGLLVAMDSAKGLSLIPLIESTFEVKIETKDSAKKEQEEKSSKKDFDGEESNDPSERDNDEEQSEEEKGLSAQNLDSNSGEYGSGSGEESAGEENYGKGRGEQSKAGDGYGSGAASNDSRSGAAKSEAGDSEKNATDSMSTNGSSSGSDSSSQESASGSSEEGGAMGTASASAKEAAKSSNVESQADRNSNSSVNSESKNSSGVSGSSESGGQSKAKNSDSGEPGERGSNGNNSEASTRSKPGIVDNSKPKTSDSSQGETASSTESPPKNESSKGGAKTKQEASESSSRNPNASTPEDSAAAQGKSNERSEKQGAKGSASKDAQAQSAEGREGASNAAAAHSKNPASSTSQKGSQTKPVAPNSKGSQSNQESDSSMESNRKSEDTSNSEDTRSPEEASVDSGRDSKNRKEKEKESKRNSQKENSTEDEESHANKDGESFGMDEDSKQDDSIDPLDSDIAEASGEELENDIPSFLDRVEAQLDEEGEAGEGSDGQIAIDKMRDTLNEMAIQDSVEKSIDSPAAEFLAEKPPGPNLTPLAMGFLMSELLSKDDITLNQIGGKYCEYLSSSCGGLRAEYWILRDGKWENKGAYEIGPKGAQHDAEKLKELSHSGKHESALMTYVKESDRSQGSGFAPILVEDQTLVAPVVSKRAGNTGNLIGALVLSGDGAELADPEYLQTCAEMTLGASYGFVDRFDESEADQAA